MNRPPVLAIAAVLAATLALPVAAQGNIARANVRYMFVDIPDSATSTNGNAMFTAAPRDDGNVHNQHWWYYRISGDTQESAFNNSGGQGFSESYAGAVARLNWSDVDGRGMISAAWRLKLYSTGQTSGVAISQMTLTNLLGAPITVDLFAHGKWNFCAKNHHTITGTPSRHHAIPDPALCTVQGQFGEWVGVNIDHYEIEDNDRNPTLRAQLVDSAITTLSDTGLPKITIPHTDHAFQWTSRRLFPNVPQTFTVLITHNFSPCDVEATWTNYGQGSTGTNGVPVIQTNRPPVIGSTNPTPTVGVTNAMPNGSGAVIIGIGRTALPFFNITVYTNPLAQVPVSFDASGAGSVQIPLPNIPAICGGILDFQALFGDPAQSPLPIVHTDGLEWVLGGYD